MLKWLRGHFRAPSKSIFAPVSLTPEADREKRRKEAREIEDLVRRCDAELAVYRFEEKRNEQ